MGVTVPDGWGEVDVKGGVRDMFWSCKGVVTPDVILWGVAMPESCSDLSGVGG